MTANDANSPVKRLIPALVIFVLTVVAHAQARATEAVSLRSAAIAGSSVYSPAELFPTYRDRLGQPITRDLARAVAASIAERYQQDGYARPELRLDESLVSEGVMQINVFEARISRVAIEGTPGRYRDQLESIAGRVRDSVPLRRDTIPQAMAQMRQLPGLTVTATTRRDGSALNAHELLIQAEYSQFSGSARMNNRGTDEIGRLFVIGQVEANDLLGWGEEIGLVFAAASDASEYMSGALYLDRPLGETGRRGMAMIARSDSAPNEAPVDRDDDYLRERYMLRVTQPLNPNVTVTGSFEMDELSIARDGIEFRDDRLRVLEAGLRSGWRARAMTQFSSVVELRKGLDALGGGLRASDLADDPRSSDFLMAQLQLTSFTRFDEAWSLRVDAFAQHSQDVLPDSERFKIGGERLGRGFEVVEIAGDHGLGGKLQLRRDLKSMESPLGRPSAYGFYDVGAAWKKDLPGRESAATLGAGLALHGERVTGYLEVARPLTHGDVEGRRNTTLFAELGYRF
ncbi:MAG: ShlB/FhaC/HecB family hemolysin secretion/activation protein [Steroidobacteraceae bacterium]